MAKKLIFNFQNANKIKLLTIEKVRQFALELPEVVEKDHVGRPSFRTRNRIFATLWPEVNRAVVKLSPVEQAAFCENAPKVFFPVHGGWGRMGFTFVELSKANQRLFIQALTSAWQFASRKKPVKPNPAKK